MNQQSASLDFNMQIAGNEGLFEGNVLQSSMRNHLRQLCQ